jgi:excisionase family DNA binding protein
VTEKEDFISFEKALRELRLQSEQLKKLVSEGDIRAYRDGASMKFKKEDVDALVAKASGEPVVFADALEDDAGMVTEELSDEDTLLAEDVPVEPVIEKKSHTVQRTSRREQITSAADSEAGPKWVTAVAVLSALVMIYGAIVVYNIATELPPGGITGPFAFK